MSVSVKVVDRKVLKNVLHHVDTHNRLMEEKEMWHSRRNWREASHDSDYETGMMSSGRRFSYGKMRSDSVHTETTREIVKLKEKAGKWNHSGFMELYPDEFLDKGSMDEMSDEGDDKNRKKRKKKMKKRKSSDDLDTRKRKRPKTSEKVTKRPADLNPKKRQGKSNSHRNSEERESRRSGTGRTLKERRGSRDRTKKEKRREESRRERSKQKKKRREKRTLLVER